MLKPTESHVAQAVPACRYKNVIFDLGGVLIYFNPKELVDNIFSDCVEKPYHLVGAVQTEAWLDMDRGKLLFPEVAQALAGEYDPAQICQYLEAIPAYLNPIAEGLRLLQEVKARGFNVYVLSNLSAYAHEATKKHTHFFEPFDGAIFSYQIGFAKPDPEMYQALLATYGLKAEECVFIDDLEKNVAAGKALGIDGILCDNYARVRRELIARGILAE